MNMFSQLKMGLLFSLSLCISEGFGQQKSETPATAPEAATYYSVCARELGVIVCREGIAPARVEGAQAETKPLDAAKTSEAEKPGKLLVLLDIPQNIFTKLADDPENNRKYHPKAPLKYSDKARAAPRAANSAPLPKPGESAWKYRPKGKVAYQPKQNWTYNRDVYGRVWRENIAHDTRVVEVPIEAPVVYLLPVAKAR